MPSPPQIHNWAADLDNESTPSLEFVSVGKSYVVVNGQKTFLDLTMVGGCSLQRLHPFMRLRTAKKLF